VSCNQASARASIGLAGLAVAKAAALAADDLDWDAAPAAVSLLLAHAVSLPLRWRQRPAVADAASGWTTALAEPAGPGQPPKARLITSANEIRRMLTTLAACHPTSSTPAARRTGGISTNNEHATTTPSDNASKITKCGWSINLTTQSLTTSESAVKFPHCCKRVGNGMPPHDGTGAWALSRPNYPGVRNARATVGGVIGGFSA
jgi:hypothetical protein